MNEINNAGKAMTSTMQRQKFRGKNNPVQAKMTHTHERIYPIHIGSKVFLKYSLTFTLYCPRLKKIKRMLLTTDYGHPMKE